MDLKAIKVRIGTKVEDGKRVHAFPDFNRLKIVQDSGMDWSYYVDQFGGWHYDKCCAHAVERPGSPVGEQSGMLLVPIEFATQASAMFGLVVTNMVEATAEEFYENHAHAHESDERVDERIVNGIAAKQNAKVHLTASDEAALDPNDPTPGITKNKNKTWAGYKDDRGIYLI